MIALALITRNPKQPRETFPQEHIERLAASIQKRGLIQPITLRPVKRGKFRYEIVAGECRFRAHQYLDAKVIRAEIVTVDDAEMQLRAIVENLQRQDMNPIEEANAFQALLDQGLNVPRIVEELGLKSPAIVNQRLTLLNLASDIQQLVASGNLPVAMAFGVAQASPERQGQLVRAIAAGKLTTAEQVRHAGIALRDAERQLDAFGELPKASPKDLAAVRGLEAKIAAITDMVCAGFKDGECVAAQRVAPDRVNKMVEQLNLIRKHVLQMEHDLRRAATQAEMRFEAV